MVDYIIQNEGLTLDQVSFGHESEREFVERLKKAIDVDERVDQNRSFIVPKLTLAQTEKRWMSDLEVFAFLNLIAPYKFENRSFYNLAMIFEVKSHRVETLDIRNESISVPYGDKKSKKMKDAISQAKASCTEANIYIRSKVSNAEIKFAWVYPFVALPRVNSSDFVNRAGNKNRNCLYFAIFNDNLTLDTICTNIFSRDSSATSSIQLVGSKNAQDYNKVFHDFKRSIPEEKAKLSRLDRQSIDVLVHDKLPIAKHIDVLKKGSPLVLKGRSGTAKTFALIELARRYNSNSRSVLLTTFNIALASDLRRLCWLYNFHLKEESLFQEDFAPYITNIDKIIVDWGKQCAKLFGEEIVASSLGKYEEDVYKPCKAAIIRALEFFPPPEIRELLSVDYDLILIDEGQDWDDEAFELLYKLKKTSCAIVIVDSDDQRLKYGRPKFVSYGDYTSIEHKVNYRNYNSIRRFSHKLFRWLPSFSEPSDVAIDEETMISRDGNISFLEDASLTKDFFSMLGKELQDDQCLWGDLLVIEPSKPTVERAKCTPAMKLLNEKNVCNAHNDNGKKKLAYLDGDQIRLLNYESCRGLEGWVVIVRLVDIAFDETFERTMRELEDSDKEQVQQEKEATQRAATLMAIACSRAVKKLIVTYRMYDHRVVRQMIRYLEKK